MNYPSYDTDRYKDRLAHRVEAADEHLDRDVSAEYQEAPLAQDWARVSKIMEEGGEAVDALIGITGQNPRKGTYGTIDDLLAELADVALTGLYALQHFTKDIDATMSIVLDRADYHAERIGIA